MDGTSLLAQISEHYKVRLAALKVSSTSNIALSISFENFDIVNSILFGYYIFITFFYLQILRRLYILQCLVHLPCCTHVHS